MRRVPHLAVLFTLLAAPSAANAAPRTVRSTATLPRGDVLTQARAALSATLPDLAAADLSPARSATLAGHRRLVRFSQRHLGHPVLGRGASVLIDPTAGRARFASVHVEPSSRLPAAPNPSLVAAAAAVLATRVAGRSYAASDGVLAWWPSPLGTRLVWAFYAGPAPGTAYAPTVLVDAHTGERVLAFDATRRDRAATVFSENPVTTPDPGPVTLDALEPGATTLTTARLAVWNCIDRGSVIRGFGFEMHACDLEQTAVADASGDFPYAFEKHFDAEDAHAEVAMFHHASRIYERMVSLGMPELEDRPLTGVVNFRMAEGLWSGNADPSIIADPLRALEPLDNAFFSPSSPFFERFWGVEGGGLWFGQGTQRDFAYDGDVVYHEFGHAAVDATANLAPYWLLDEQGAHPESGAMNEGVADYFSSAMTGDSLVGEYVGQAFGMAAIRDIDNADACPDSTAGEVHVDSTLFSGALWSVRKTLADAEALELDRAIVEALNAAPSGELGYHDLAELVVAAVEASPLGAATADELLGTFEARGVLPGCVRLRHYDGSPLIGPSPTLGHAFYSPGKAIVGIPESVDFAPGHFQLRVSIGEKTAELQIRWQNLPAPSSGLSFGGEGSPFEPAILVKFGDDPIRFEYGPGIRHDAEDPAAATGGGFTSSVTVPVPEGATRAHVMLVNRGDQDGLFTDLFVRQLDAKPPMGAGGTSGTGGTGFGAGGTGGVSGAAGAPLSADEDAPELRLAGGGCGCRAGATDGTGSATATALAAALLLARRRRARGARA